MTLNRVVAVVIFVVAVVWAGGFWRANDDVKPAVVALVPVPHHVVPVGYFGQRIAVHCLGQQLSATKGVVIVADVSRPADHYAQVQHELERIGIPSCAWSAPGLGHSPSPQAPSTQRMRVQLSGTLADVVNGCPVISAWKEYTLVGHGYGAVVAQHFALGERWSNTPARLTSMVLMNALPVRVYSAEVSGVFGRLRPTLALCRLYGVWNQLWYGVFGPPEPRVAANTTLPIVPLTWTAQAHLSDALVDVMTRATDDTNNSVNDFPVPVVFTLPESAHMAPVLCNEWDADAEALLYRVLLTAAESTRSRAGDTLVKRVTHVDGVPKDDREWMSVLYPIDTYVEHISAKES